jgi:hypothetical protein
MATNHFGVAPSQWRKWSPTRQGVFNRVFRAMLKNQVLFTHPKMAPMPLVQWRTVAWNAAWTAADSASGQAMKQGDTVVDINARGREVRRHKVA